MFLITFDNVKGFFHWFYNLEFKCKKQYQKYKLSYVFDKNENKIRKKRFYGKLKKSINKWIKNFDDKFSMLLLIWETFTILSI
ncbi:MAG: hypothetical protein B6I24_01680 [Bacteroidetes bacterium 4572_128]|nr:MAG: hypothetical protein B6I24_01680 [Bacteroidetes bacterium 4572_128]